MGRVGGRGWVGGPFNSAPDNMKPLGAIRRGWEWGTAHWEGREGGPGGLGGLLKGLGRERGVQDEVRERLALENIEPINFR